MTETAILGGGCFWCTEAAFTELEGVEEVQSGYAGGTLVNPSYKAICTGQTGHAEVVEVKFNPEVISFEDLLRVFFTIHDPTTLNRQGADIGTQYRSVIFYTSPAQEASSHKIIREFEASGVWGRQIVTEVSPAPVFYRAEAEHDQYFARNPWAGYCQVVIEPKVAKLRKMFANRLRKAA
jgi:peptide-methionine (S)-S-oxide reductase